jgi:hypothetical protein
MIRNAFPSGLYGARVSFFREKGWDWARGKIHINKRRKK